MILVMPCTAWHRNLAHRSTPSLFTCTQQEWLHAEHEWIYLMQNGCTYTLSRNIHWAGDTEEKRESAGALLFDEPCSSATLPSIALLSDHEVIRTR